VADVQLVPGPSTIRRVDRKRNIAITADVEEGIDANAIVTEMLQQYTPEWRREFTGFQLSTDGNLKAQAQFGAEFTNNFIKIFILVFALFAIAFRSFFQPVLVMLAIPFGFVGAIIGHLLFNVDLSMFSGFGFLACSGVVVNDNLVLLERINQLKERGYAVKDAVMQAGVDRFRPILLTSVTTFVGLVPILFERSTQSLFLKPMVVSLAFGVLFSTVVTLFLVPCGYLSGHELRDAIKRLTKKVFKEAH
jgi:multidrug efflux pump subunit AcrB